MRALHADDLSMLAKRGLDQTIAMRAIAQDMGWVLNEGSHIQGAATARLADGTVFVDALVGEQAARIALIDHAIAYARWSYAPAVTIRGKSQLDVLEARGFVGLEPAGLPPELAAAAGSTKVLMKRL